MQSNYRSASRRVTLATEETQEIRLNEEKQESRLDEDRISAVDL